MQTLKEIRLAMGYSIRGFAELLGFDCHSTYQHYESGRRPASAQVLIDAQAAYDRDKRFFAVDIPERIASVPKFMGVAE